MPMEEYTPESTKQNKQRILSKEDRMIIHSILRAHNLHEVSHIDIGITPISPEHHAEKGAFTLISAGEQILNILRRGR